MSIIEQIVGKIIHWIGIDDHADNWTIAHFEGGAEKPVVRASASDHRYPSRIRIRPRMGSRRVFAISFPLRSVELAFCASTMELSDR